ncbi:MAG: SIS domain-containing protein [Paludibacter sp.]|nr:SIS domain-containing protein [Paludibacter sp.]
MIHITSKEGTHTISEIHQQPKMWLKEFDLIYQEKNSIETFLSKNNISKDAEIILTGAGTSAYIGNILTYILPLKGYKNCKAVATTDLITHPDAFFSSEKNIVLVSFARSGNSPESLAAVEIVNKIAKKALHIIITCNEMGELVKNAQHDNSLILLLPPDTNDKSLAMTSSFTTMLVALLLLINVNKIEDQLNKINAISVSAKNMLDKYAFLIEKIASLNFKRAVFLGSGELKGIAEECQLKLQELTDGKVICKFDSFLGFRHGPKAVINNETLIVYLFSTNEFVRQYEIDLVKQINANNNVTAQIAISAGQSLKIERVKFDLELVMDHSFETSGEYSFIPYVLIGQTLGYYKSLFLGLDPDNPSVSGNISRVVEGVTIYNNYFLV